VAEHYARMRQAQVLAARAIVRRGMGRGEIAPDTSVTLLLDTLIGGAMMHAMATPEDRRADLARHTGAYAAQLVSFLMRAVSAA
jgi:Tetracyclin repressor-like, C-terminal domain